MDVYKKAAIALAVGGLYNPDTEEPRASGMSDTLGLPYGQDTPQQSTVLSSDFSVPDRLSIDPDTPYYDADFIFGAKRIDVYLNGEKRPRDVREYCISEGWIKVQVKRNGRVVLERGVPRTIVLEGEVKVVVS